MRIDLIKMFEPQYRRIISSFSYAEFGYSNCYIQNNYAHPNIDDIILVFDIYQHYDLNSGRHSTRVKLLTPTGSIYWQHEHIIGTCTKRIDNV